MWLKVNLHQSFRPEHPPNLAVGSAGVWFGRHVCLCVFPDEVGPRSRELGGSRNVGPGHQGPGGNRQPRLAGQ